MTILKIKKLENYHNLNLPKYETAGSAGMDLLAAIDEDVILKAGEIKLVKCGISIAHRGHAFGGRVRCGRALVVQIA